MEIFKIKDACFGCTAKIKIFDNNIDTEHVLNLAQELVIEFYDNFAFPIKIEETLSSAITGSQLLIIIDDLSLFVTSMGVS